MVINAKWGRINAKWGRACFDNFFVEFDVCNITQGETQVTVHLCEQIQETNRSNLNKKLEVKT